MINGFFHLQSNTVSGFPNERLNLEVKLKETLESNHQLAKTIVERIDSELNKKYLVLVADDEPLLFELIREFLASSRINCDIITAQDGTEANELAQSWVPDLIITDWLMPKMNGLELIKSLRGNDETKEIPIIIITGMLAGDTELESILSMDSIDYLRKPLDNLEFCASVRTALTLNDSLHEIRKFKKSESSNDEFVKFLINAVPSPIFYLDRLNQFIGCNRHFENLFGKQRAEIVGRTVKAVFPDSTITALQVDREHSDHTQDFRVTIENEYNFIVSCTAVGTGNGQIRIGHVNDLPPMLS